VTSFRAAQVAEKFTSVEISAEMLEDKIRGGLLGQILGDLNGLPHEMRYIHEPGNVAAYTPSLPQGAWTDDDTDIEWVYVTAMHKNGQLILSPDQIIGLWRAHINRKIWCANNYARGLMDLGLMPPLTGRIAINPWSGFNLSGQFICETFGLIAPAMPRTGVQLGLHYTQVAIDGEPAQATQLFATMIALAFVETNVVKLVEAGLDAVDARSDMRRIVSDVRRWWEEQPRDWRATRHKIKQRYSRVNGEMRDRNGCELNGASVIAALLYGQGDFVETVRLAFNFGWDADNNAATSGTIAGVIKGRRWLEAQGWNIRDVYKNTTRDQMPAQETITSLGDKLIALARSVILENNGLELTINGQKNFRIRRQTPANVQPLPAPLDRMPELRRQLLPALEEDLARPGTDAARAAYLALCLGQADRLRQQHPAAWAQGLAELKKFPNVMRNIFDAPPPSGAVLKRLATAAGLEKP
jgi:hypothetical protein